VAAQNVGRIGLSFRRDPSAFYRAGLSYARTVGAEGAMDREDCLVRHLSGAKPTPLFGGRHPGRLWKHSDRRNRSGLQHLPFFASGPIGKRRGFTGVGFGLRAGAGLFIQLVDELSDRHRVAISYFFGRGHDTDSGAVASGRAPIAMPKRTDIETILIIGPAHRHRQACEFDYSGAQAVKVLKKEGYRVVLINRTGHHHDDPNSPRHLREPHPVMVDASSRRRNPSDLPPWGPDGLNLAVNFTNGQPGRYGVS